MRTSVPSNRRPGRSAGAASSAVGSVLATPTACVGAARRPRSAAGGARSGSPGRVRPEGQPGGSAGQDVDQPAALAAAELDRALGQGEERVVATAADVGAGVEPGAALAHQDLAGLDGLAVVGLD